MLIDCTKIEPRQCHEFRSMSSPSESTASTPLKLVGREVASKKTILGFELCQFKGQRALLQPSTIIQDARDLFVFLQL
jgi:hypothetical protein